jgi:hypothetical protein
LRTFSSHLLLLFVPDCITVQPEPSGLLRHQSAKSTHKYPSAAPITLQSLHTDLRAQLSPLTATFVRVSLTDNHPSDNLRTMPISPPLIHHPLPTRVHHPTPHASARLHRAARGPCQPFPRDASCRRYSSTDIFIGKACLSIRERQSSI